MAVICLSSLRPEAGASVDSIEGGKPMSLFEVINLIIEIVSLIIDVIGLVFVVLGTVDTIDKKNNRQ